MPVIKILFSLIVLKIKLNISIEKVTSQIMIAVMKRSGMIIIKQKLTF